MSTKHPEIFEALAAPFHASDVKQRAGQGNQKLSYITARTVENRLDEVLGPEGWDFELTAWGTDLIGTLVIRLPDGSVVRKSDVGGRAGMKTGDDDTKSAASDALKRCAVLLGVGRYLYNDGQVSFVQHEPQNARTEKPKDERSPAERLRDWAAKEGHLERVAAIALSVYNCRTLDLTKEQALAVHKLIVNSGAVANVPQPEPKVPPPAPEPAARPAPPLHTPGVNANGNPVKFGWPHSGAALYAWCKALEASFKTSIVPQVEEAFCGTKLPADKRWDRSFRTWNADQVETAAKYVAGFISAFPGYSGEFDAKLPPSIQNLRDRLWEVAGKLTEAMVQQPTSANIEAEIQRTSQSLAAKFGGEVISNLDECDNREMLQAILDVMEQDLKDSNTVTGTV
jgi:hypothetical protein